MASKKKWPSIKDGKPSTKTPVKFYPGLGVAPTIKKAKRLPGQRKGYNV
jgi:hypothetical protein